VSTEILVVDTSSLAQVRRIQWIAKAREREVFQRLNVLVDTDQLVFPTQVVDELKNYGDQRERYLPYEWARKHKQRAGRFGPLFEVVRELLADSQVAKVLDPDKPGVDEADPHVLALAVHLRGEGYGVVVLNEERRDRPSKLSMATACGLLRLVSLPMEAFLVQRGILPQHS
jgi:hypothetical protein